MRKWGPVSRLEILGYLAGRFTNGGLLGVRSNIEGKMMALGRRIRLLAGKAPPNPDQTLAWEILEIFEYIPAKGINELDRHTKSGYHSKYS